jgi:hypothetical protein
MLSCGKKTGQNYPARSDCAASGSESALGVMVVMVMVVMVMEASKRRTGKHHQ